MDNTINNKYRPSAFCKYGSLGKAHRNYYNISSNIDFLTRLMLYFLVRNFDK